MFHFCEHIKCTLNKRIKILNCLYIPAPLYVFLQLFSPTPNVPATTRVFLRSILSYPLCLCKIMLHNYMYDYERAIRALHAILISWSKDNLAIVSTCIMHLSFATTAPTPPGNSGDFDFHLSKPPAGTKRQSSHR